MPTNGFLRKNGSGIISLNLHLKIEKMQAEATFLLNFFEVDVGVFSLGINPERPWDPGSKNRNFLVFHLFTNIIINKITKLWQSHKTPGKKQKRNPRKP